MGGRTLRTGGDANERRPHADADADADVGGEVARRGGGAAAGAVRTFRGPAWWWVAGVGFGAGAVLGAFTEVLIGVVLGLGTLGVLFLLLATRARVDVGPDGVVVRPNGCRTFTAAWVDIGRVRGNRLVIGDRLVTVPPLAGQPLRHILDELEHRGVPRPADRPPRPGGRFGRRRTVA
jgi:hypothetical protein